MVKPVWEGRSGHPVIIPRELFPRIPAEDRSGDLILRLYESKKADTTCNLAINFPVKEVSLCNMLEETRETLKVKEGTVQLRFNTFEVKTIRIKV